MVLIYMCRVLNRMRLIFFFTGVIFSLGHGALRDKSTAQTLMTMQISTLLRLHTLSWLTSITLLEDKRKKSVSFFRSQHFQPVHWESISALHQLGPCRSATLSISSSLTGLFLRPSASFSRTHTHTHTLRLHDQLCVRCANESACCYIIL